MSDVQFATVLRHVRAVVPSGTPRSDGQLLHAFAAHDDQAAFAQIVRRYGPVVLGVCRRVLGHQQDAEDAFQATFLVLARKAGSVRKGEALASFLHGVSYRIAMRAKRDAARRRRHEGHARGGLQGPLVGAASRAAPGEVRLGSPDLLGGEIAWREVQAILDQEVEALPDIYRTAFVLCCLQGHSQAEAAREMGVKVGTVSSRLTHARKRLGEALARRGITLTAVLAALALTGTARAALPRTLAQTTAEMATGFVGAGVRGLPARVLSLAEGALPTVLAAKMKLAGALVLTLALFATGAAALWQRHASAGESSSAQAPAANRRPSPIDKGEGRVITGRVLGPDGKPVKGAKVYVSPYTWKDHPAPRAVTTTDAAGRFRLTALDREVDRHDMVVAVADGFAPDWAALGHGAPDSERTLRLVKDVPISGRVLDLEGRPVAGVAVRLITVRKDPGEDLTTLVKDLQASARDRNSVGHNWVAYQEKAAAIWGILGVPRSVTTDREGRFRRAGCGRERVVNLEVKGPTIARADLYVLTRPGLKGLPPDVHGATFAFLAGPTKPIRGTVKDRRTGKPVAGIEVGAQPYLGDHTGAGVSTTTDARGRFTLLGLPKARSYHLGVGGAPYVSTSKELADTPALEAIETSIEVERALTLRVRVIDKATGRPVPAYIQYAIRANNPNLERYPTYQRNVVSWSINDRDGFLTQTVLPGKALIAVQARKGEFTRARLKDPHGDDQFIGNLLATNLWLSMWHAIVPVDFAEKDPKSLVVTIALDPGRSVHGRVVAPDGKPLEGALAAGLTAVQKVSRRMPAGSGDRLAGSSFTAAALEPAHPRTVVLYHEEKKLAKALTLRGDERGPLTVRLEPLGSLAGRLVDAGGQPVAGADVLVRASRSMATTLPGELTVNGLGSLRNIVAYRDAKTDREGRFRLDGVVAGMKYDLWCNDREGKFRGPVKHDLAAPPGKTVDLGDVRAGSVTGKKGR
jgi:RNA polymerase sigma factor (sigma-70 family)